MYALLVVLLVCLAICTLDSFGKIIEFSEPVGRSELVLSVARQIQRSRESAPSRDRRQRPQCVFFSEDYSLATYNHIIEQSGPIHSPQEQFFISTIGAILNVESIMRARVDALRTQGCRIVASSNEMLTFNATLGTALMELEAHVGSALLRRRTSLGISIWSTSQTLIRQLLGLAGSSGNAKVGTCEEQLANLKDTLAAVIRTAVVKLWQLTVLIVHLTVYTSIESHMVVPRIKLRRDLGFFHQEIICNLLMWQSFAKAGHVALKMVEVGVDDAWHAALLLGSLPFLSYLGVDPYSREENDDGVESEERRYADAALRLMRFTGRAHLLRTASVEAAPWIQAESLDLIWIDGLHTQEAVAEDLRVWLPKVRSGGIVAGHDYHDLSPGVILAVHEVFNEQPSADGTLHIAPDWTYFWFKT